MSRPDWNGYFLGIAEAVSKRADCSRRRVGAIIVKDNRIISTGYNGAPSGDSGCLSGACPRATSEVSPGSSYDTGPGACIAVHAEANAIVYADGNSTRGAAIYVTHQPCEGCSRLIRAAGISTVVFPRRTG